MLKIHQLFFRSFLTIFFVTIAFLSVVVFYWAKNVHIAQTKKAIITNINSIEVSLDSLQDIDKKLVKIKEKTNLRVTIINLEGKVIGETHEDKEIMENHANRIEIIDAKYDDIGSIIRHSTTLDKDFLYVAKKIDINGKDYYLRISENIDILENDFNNLTLQVIAIFATFLLASILASYLLSRKIQEETDLILQYLSTLSSKKKLPKLAKPITQEFDKMLNILRKVASKLAKKEKIKAKHLAKLDLANKQKDEIISAISHEFKNPIAVISGYVQTLRHDDDIPESLRNKFLAKIDQNTVKMTNIIDRLRLSLKLEQSKEKLDLKKVNLYNLINQLKDDLQDKYTNREIELSGDKDCSIEIDETLFGIAITNLIENGLKYSEDKLIVKIYKDCILIQDKGIGIEEKDLEQIMKKFYRVSNNKWNNSLGLGLHIVNNIINLHKFKIEIKSVYHEGTEFRINFKN